MSLLICNTLRIALLSVHAHQAPAIEDILGQYLRTVGMQPFTSRLVRKDRERFRDLPASEATHRGNFRRGIRPRDGIQGSLPVGSPAPVYAAYQPRGNFTIAYFREPGPAVRQWKGEQVTPGSAVPAVVAG
ncbi:hypothetical protein GCM10027444_21290 [Actinopolyspora lacussalsi]